MGTQPLPINGADLDATAPPGVKFSNSLRHLLFDDTTVETCRWNIRMPPDFASAPIGKIQYSMVSDITNQIAWELSLWAVTPGTSGLVDSESYDAVNLGTETVPATAAGRLSELSIALTNADSVAPGDWVTFRLARKADDGVNDTAVGDAELWNVAIEYTST